MTWNFIFNNLRKVKIKRKISRRNFLKHWESQGRDFNISGEREETQEKEEDVGNRNIEQHRTYVRRKEDGSAKMQENVLWK